MQLLQWGLIPAWISTREQAEKIRKGTYNARAETLEEKPSFSHLFKKYRCLIPTDGFYEWKEIPGRKTKQPYFIGMGDGGLFAMAGLWSTWQDKMTGDVIESCAIITTEPNSLLADIHTRMPVILHPDQYDPWLDSQTRTGMLRKIFKPFDAADMILHAVSGLCNSPKNDSPECIKAMP